MSDDLEIESRLPQTLNEWQGIHARIFRDTTSELDVEGARMCAKTTLLLDKEIHYLKEYPGIHSFICRYTDIATRTKLKPRFEAICRIRGLLKDRDYDWNDDELCYEFARDTRVYAFGVKAANQNERYDKIRGLDVSRAYNDQSESLPSDLGQELRASLRQKGFPHQITFSPNPVPPNHWLADARHGGFPEDDSFKGRKYYRLSLDDNAYNLDPADIERMKRTYPPEHAKHAAMILGKRSVLVIGEAIFENTFNRLLHIRPIALDINAPVLEAFSFGKSNPTWLLAQRMHQGGLALYGGIIAEDLFLEDFLPVVKEYREQWLTDVRAGIKTACPPPGAQNQPSTGTRFTNVQFLRNAGFGPLYFRDGGNSADVAFALIQQLAGYMRRRNASGQEAFAINSDASRWLKASRLEVEPWPIAAQAFEAGIVWDEHWRSAHNNRVRQSHEDDWFDNILQATQAIELNFCADQLTPAELEKRKSEANARQRAQRGEEAFMGPHGYLAL